MKLNFKTYGQGDPIVVLHGLFGTLDNWQTIAKSLAKDYMVYLVDQRNHGKSFHADIHNYQAMSEDLREFMESEWLHEAHIIGHSMGGKTAMQFAVDFPDMIDKLIVVDIGPQAYKGNHELIFKALFSIDIDSLESRSEALERMSIHITEPGVMQFLLKNLSRKKEGGFKWKMNLKVLHDEYSAILDAITSEESFLGESLFLRGGKSNYIQQSDEHTILSLFPSAKITTIPKAGHWVHADAPKELLAEISNFLST